MKPKKLMLGLGLALLGNFAQAQDGLEGIIVEKYYKATSADAAGSTGILPAGSVTYRVYVDMVDANWKLQSVYGNRDAGNAPLHELLIKSSTTFFNEENRGNRDAVIGGKYFKDATVALDSWFSMGAVSASSTGPVVAAQVGVLKSEDNGALNIVTSGRVDGLLAGTVFPLTAQDGAIAGTSQAVTYIGGTDVLADNVFGAVSQAGGSFSTFDGAVYPAADVAGPTATNRVLIGQFTTDGIFEFKLNLQLRNAVTLEVQNFVSSNPQAGERTMASLTGIFGVPPTISITTVPATGGNFFLGNPVSIAATAADADGTVASVEFFDGAVSKGTITSAPWTFTFTPTGAGAHSITAKATDNEGNVTTSAASTLTGLVNALPTAVITAPTAGTIAGLPVLSTQTITITATSTDTDGTVVLVEFFANNVLVGTDATGSPFSFDWTPSAYGINTLKAVSHDNNGGVTTSANVVITLTNPNAKPYFVKNLDTTCVSPGFCLPINAKDTVKNVIGFDMVLHYNKAKVIPTGSISAGADLVADPAYVTVASNIDAVNGKMNISVSLNNAAPVNTFFNGVGEMICVAFNKTAGFASIDTALFTIDSIVESRYTGVTTVLADGGKFITYRDSTFHASLKFWADNSAIKFDTANASTYLKTDIFGNNLLGTAPSIIKVQPNTSGNFDYVVNQADLGNLTFNIDRDVADSVSVQPIVNGFDALLTRKVAISDASFMPSIYQIIAMDVNQDGKITAGDVSQINQRSVLSIPEFKQAWNYNAAGVKVVAKPSRDWVFIDETTLTTKAAYLISSIFPMVDGAGFSKDNVPVPSTEITAPVSDPNGCPVINAEAFTGVMVGDVNGNYKNIAADGVLKSATTDKIVFDLSKAIADDGYVNIPVSIMSDKTINALDFSMQFDAGVVYNAIVNHTNMDVLNNLNADDATLRFTSYSLENFDITAPIVSIRVEASQVNEGDLKSLAGYLNGDQVNVEVIGGGVTAPATASSSLSVYPNPATETVNVLVSENAKVELFNMNGTVVVSLNVNANQAQVISTENLANGVYTLKASNGNFVKVEIVVIAK